jgi:hypothetical protein
MKHKSFIVSVMAGLSILSTAVRTIAQEATPFGICAHLQGGEEHEQMPENLQLIRNAGIRWLRVDFSWSGIESPQGAWHYDHIDRVLKQAEANDLHILPLLLYNVGWADPAYQHLDFWLEYVEKTVTRYKDKCRYWEIWNEPNLFWDNPDGVTYKILLEATYKKIKEIDPELTVLYGGTSGIPMQFIERSLEAGIGEFFDIVNIHPYRGRMTSVGLSAGYLDDLDRLRDLMDKYHIGHKKIWITEMGWSTWTPVNSSNKAAFHEMKNKIAPNRKWKVAVVSDKNYPIKKTLPDKEIRALFTEDYDLRFIRIPDLKTEDLAQYDALFLPPWEEYPVVRLWEELLPVFNYGLRGVGKVYFYGDVAVTEKDQAIGLPQSMLLSFRFGIDRYFWYEFQAPEQNPFDREDYFGLVHRNLEPKPVYHACATLCKVFKEGSVVDKSIEWNRKNFCLIRWTQPDGTRVWAVWAPGGDRKVTVKIGSGLQQAVDFLGAPLPVTETTRTLSIGPGITYLVGPKTLDIH